MQAVGLIDAANEASKSTRLARSGIHLRGGFGVPEPPDLPPKDTLISPSEVQFQECRAQFKTELRAELDRFGECVLSVELKKAVARLEEGMQSEMRRISKLPRLSGITVDGMTTPFELSKQVSHDETSSKGCCAGPGEWARDVSLDDSMAIASLALGRNLADSESAPGSAGTGEAEEPRTTPSPKHSSDREGLPSNWESTRWDEEVAGAESCQGGPKRLSFMARGDPHHQFFSWTRSSIRNTKKTKRSLFRTSQADVTDNDLSSTLGQDLEEATASSSLATSGYRAAQNFRPPASKSSRTLLARVVESQEFDALNAFFIISNAITIGAQTDYLAKHVTDEVPSGYRTLELIFACIFTSELVLRIINERASFIYGSQWRWNMFDSFVVGMQVAEELLTFVAFGGTSSFMRAVRLLRLARILRIVRILRLIGELRTIISSIAGSLRHVCWTLVLLALIIYAVAVYLTQMVSNRAVELKQAGGEALSHEELQFFGDLGASVSTLFESIAGGVDWYTYTRPLGGRISPLVPVIVISYISFTLFAILNSVTGVFVESANRSAKHDTEQFVLGLAQNLLAKVDLDGNGHVTWEEFQACLGYQEMQLYFESLDLDIEDAAALFKLLDFDGSGTISYAEFLQGCFRLRGAAKAIEFASFVSVFHDRMNKQDKRWYKLEAAIKSIANSMKVVSKHLIYIAATTQQCAARNNREPLVTGSAPPSEAPPERPSQTEPSLEFPRLPVVAQESPKFASRSAQEDQKLMGASRPASPAELKAGKALAMPLIEEEIMVHPAKSCHIMHGSTNVTREAVFKLEMSEEPPPEPR